MTSATFSSAPAGNMPLCFNRALPNGRCRRKSSGANGRRYNGTTANGFGRLAADGGERCANCGAAEKLVLDHVIPIAKGGLSQLENLQLLCTECNRIKGKLMIDCRSFTQRK